jgi:UDP-N-acetylmuramoyl-tripeptide--D-alanyl-D-alanine ligase
MSFRLFELANATGGRLIGADADLALDRLVIDSRQATPGSLFVALVGETTDGHRFLAQAVEAGASAVLCQSAPADLVVPRVEVDDTREALVHFTRHRLERQGCTVVGITGSVGKTSTKEMVAAVLARRFGVLKTEGNLNTYTGLPMTVARLEPSHQVLVAEYAMSAIGEIAFLSRMAPPDIAVVLNVGLSHVGLLGDIEAIGRAKRELVEGLGPEGTAVLNADDPRVLEMALASAGRVVTFGYGQSKRHIDVRAEEITPRGLDGSDFTLALPTDERVRVELGIPGVHAISNALAAAAVGHVLGVAAADIVAALDRVHAVAGRGALRPGRLGSIVIDDAYNASPSSMAAALEVLLAETGRPRIAVLGEMLELGDQAAEAHQKVGRQAARSDLLVALGEHAADIVEGAHEAGLRVDRAIVVDSAAEAVAAVEPHLKGALVLVKASRGLALEQVVDRLVQP